jgi:hypothetical protein
MIRSISLGMNTFCGAARLLKIDHNADRWRSLLRDEPPSRLSLPEWPVALSVFFVAQTAKITNNGSLKASQREDLECGV